MLKAVTVLFHSIWWQFYLAVTISKIQLDLPIEAHDEKKKKKKKLGKMKDKFTLNSNRAQICISSWP